MVVLQQSKVLCGATAAIGGILEVFSTAVLAYPAAKAAEGIFWSQKSLRKALVVNLFFQICASISGNLIATWFGPISIVGPIFFAAQLVANLIIFWVALGLEEFTKQMQIGTYVIAVAVVLLVVVGPDVQGDQVFETLIAKPWAAIWTFMLIVGMFASAIFLTPGKLAVTNIQKQWKRSAILLTARATAFSLMLTTGRALILKAPTSWIIGSTFLKVIAGGIYTRAIVIQSTAVEQAVFVPLNTVISLFVNAMTGIIVWEDYLVVGSWTGYVCVYLLFILGICLLLQDLALLEDVDPKAFRARWSLARPSERRETFNRIRNYGMSNENFEEDSVMAEQSEAFSIRSSSQRTPAQRRASYDDAWNAMLRTSGSHLPPHQRVHADGRSSSVLSTLTTGSARLPGVTEEEETTTNMDEDEDEERVGPPPLPSLSKNERTKTF